MGTHKRQVIRTQFQRSQHGIVGAVVGNRFIKRLSGKKHFLHSPAAIAFDIDSLKTAEKLGATVAHIIDRDTGKEYFVFISTIFEKGFEIDRGYGEQIALPLREWSTAELIHQPRLLCQP